MSEFSDGMFTENELATASVRPKAHYSDVIMGAIASQVTSLTIVY